jgi:hypothetical protein
MTHLRPSDTGWHQYTHYSLIRATGRKQGTGTDTESENVSYPAVSPQSYRQRSSLYQSLSCHVSCDPTGRDAGRMQSPSCNVSHSPTGTEAQHISHSPVLCPTVPQAQNHETSVSLLSCVPRSHSIDGENMLSLFCSVSSSPSSITY